MPNENQNILSFTSIHMQHLKSYVVYADFESLLVPVSTTLPNPSSSSQTVINHHIPCGYAYLIVGPEGKSLKPIQMYRGEDAVKHFMDAILKEKEELAAILKNKKPMNLTPEQEQAFREATECSICGKPLGVQRARDHCHLSSAYRGAAHIYCNLNYKQPLTIPILFHNLRNYDAHHIMTEIGKYPEIKIDVIPNTLEKYIAFQIKKSNCPIKLIFMDSFQFLPSSLEKLVQNINESSFTLLKENFPSSSNLNLLRRKGVYPYSYLSSLKKFEEKELPPPSAFYNDLTQEDIRLEDYQHAQTVWQTFHLKTLGEYHDLYVKTDVLLLADVFQNFRKLCLQYYKIDPTHVYTASGLSWQAFLKMTDMQLELFTEVDMLLFIEQGVRGGVAQISTRYAKSNIPGTQDFKPELPNSYIQYWDANNLYGWAMSQSLPYGGFKWVQPENLTEQDILTTPDDSPTGFILEVDLEYPAELHDLHNDLPLCPESLQVEENMLSPFCQNLLKNKKFTKSTKLIPNLQNKKNYVLHYINLKYYIQQGLKITQIHKILQFKQAPWLESYIHFNTEKRKQATTTFEKDFFKLLNNSIYGKCIENLRSRRTIEVTNNSIRAEKIAASPRFKTYKIFDENLAAVERVKSCILMNRPVYVGFTILELAKIHMYKFHYGIIKKHYQDRATLLFTDTDSLTYHIQTKDIYTDLTHFKDQFDFSDYPKDHPLHSNRNKKVLGKFKDELNAKHIYEFVGLKAKMYSVDSEDGVKKRAKGVSTRALKKQ